MLCVCAALVTAALGTASLSLCGLYCNHADLSPRYAPFLLGMTNTIGAVPGIIGVAVTGAILDATGKHGKRTLRIPSAALIAHVVAWRNLCREQSCHHREGDLHWCGACSRCAAVACCHWVVCSWVVWYWLDSFGGGAFLPHSRISSNILFKVRG